jgi:DNA adenine methylase
MAFPGGKSLHGIFQKIINQIPPHDIYIEPFLGDGGVLRRKKSAAMTIGIDSDPANLSRWNNREIPNLTLYRCDGIEWLKHAFHLYQIKPSHQQSTTLAIDGDRTRPRVFVYADPPYLRETRESKRSLYRHEMSDQQHLELLETVTCLPCCVMVSGYQSQMYLQKLSHWRLITFATSTRSNRNATECLWMNFEEPAELHDYRYLGTDKRERERIRRKVTNWRTGLERLPILERHAITQAVFDVIRANP